ncbi:DJ-1/PfpI family protein [Ectothiorhodospiraceae bacterium 2226]|nr:DJ-1/PfpI family protein [Ectothiorhodospiraceae bacterium 2226]
MARVLVPLAEGCEELEAVTIIDLLRRAEVEVVTAGLRPGPVRASRGTVLVPDVTLDQVLEQDFDLIALPGGLPGADHLAQDERLLALLRAHAERGRYTAAICAGPKVLARAGLLDGRRATCFPGALDQDAGGAALTDEPVVVDGRVITSKGPGTAMDFALTLIEQLVGRDRRERVEGALQRAA